MKYTYLNTDGAERGDLNIECNANNVVPSVGMIIRTLAGAEPVRVTDVLIQPDVDASGKPTGILCGRCLVFQHLPS